MGGKGKGKASGSGKGQGKYKGQSKDKGKRQPEAERREGKGRKKGKLAEPMPDDQVLSCKWACSIRGYPEVGEENSWRSIVEVVGVENGHDIKLSGQTGLKDIPRLVLRGPRVREMFAIVVSMTRDAGIDLSGVSLPVPVAATVSSNSAGVEEDEQEEDRG